VTVGSDTTVTVTEEGSVSDLAVGDTITATGESTDSGVTATTITEGGSGMGGFPGRRGETTDSGE
jgi:hypothetical protein